MRLLPASALRAGARRRSTQIEISEAKKEMANGLQHGVKRTRSALCARLALVSRLDLKESRAGHTGNRDDLHQTAREDLL